MSNDRNAVTATPSTIAAAVERAVGNSLPHGAIVVGLPELVGKFAEAVAAAAVADTLLNRIKRDIAYWAGPNGPGLVLSPDSKEQAQLAEIIEKTVVHYLASPPAVNEKSKSVGSPFVPPALRVGEMYRDDVRGALEQVYAATRPTIAGGWVPLRDHIANAMVELINRISCVNPQAGEFCRDDFFILLQQYVGAAFMDKHSTLLDGLCNVVSKKLTGG